MRTLTVFATGRGIARFGDGMLPVGLAAVVLGDGGHAGQLGLAMAAFTAFFAGSVVLGGLLTTRCRALDVMVATDLVRAVSLGTTALALATWRCPFWLLCASGAVNGVCAGLFQPGVASTTRLVAEDVRTANAVLRTVEACATVAGPAVAGMLVAVTTTAWVFALHAGCSLASAACLSRIDRRPDGPRPLIGARAALTEAVGELRGRRWLSGVLVIWLGRALLVEGPSVPLVAVAVNGDDGSAGYAAVRTAVGLGMVAGALAALVRSPTRPLRAGAVALSGQCLLPLFAATRAPAGLLLPAAAVSGAAAAFWGVMWAASVQSHVPVARVDRVHALDVALSIAMLPVGQALSGPSAAAFGLRPVLAANAIAAVLVCAALLGSRSIRGLGADPAARRPAQPQV